MITNACNESDRKIRTTTDYSICIRLPAQITKHLLSAVGQIQPHHPVVRFQQRRVDSEVCGTARVRLHVDAPSLRVKVKQFQRSILTQRLHFVDYFGAAVIPDKPPVCSYKVRCQCEWKCAHIKLRLNAAKAPEASVNVAMTMCHCRLLQLMHQHNTDLLPG